MLIPSLGLVTPMLWVNREALRIMTDDARDGRDLWLLRADPPPIDWLVRDVLPCDVAGDVFGPPNVGKSTLLYHLAASIAGGDKTWAGKPIKNGPVLVITTETSSPAALHRLLHPLIVRIVNPQHSLRHFESVPLWRWDSQTATWQDTVHVHTLEQLLRRLHPVLCLIDTLPGAVEGMQVMDYASNYSLAMRLQALATQNHTTVLTVSHSNQGSQGPTASLADRLHWAARLGSTGGPAGWRWMMGVTVTTIPKQENMPSHPSSLRWSAAAVTKHNEIIPAWTDQHPLFFSLHEGQLLWSASLSHTPSLLKPRQKASRSPEILMSEEDPNE